MEKDTEKSELQEKWDKIEEILKEQDKEKLEKTFDEREFNEISVEINADYIKQFGSEHYKTGGIEPIDLYESGGILKHFAIGSIIKYAFRNREKISKDDMNKIIHFASILLFKYGE